MPFLVADETFSFAEGTFSFVGDAILMVDASSSGVGDVLDEDTEVMFMTLYNEFLEVERLKAGNS